MTENPIKAVAQVEYVSAIGSLKFARYFTKPDIVFLVCKLSRLTKIPCAMHWDAIEKVLQFLKKTKNLGLFYDGFPTMFQGYSDAS